MCISHRYIWPKKSIFPTFLNYLGLVVVVAGILTLILGLKKLRLIFDLRKVSGLPP